MGTLAVTYNGTTKSYTMSGAPAVAYNGKTLLAASSWSGTKTLKCSGKCMKTDVTVGSRTLKCSGKLAKTDIVLKYTIMSPTSPSIVTTTKTITVPEGYNKVQFFAVGGGGAGGRVYDLENNKCEAGGGGGGYTKEVTLTTAPGTVYTLKVGPGAAAVGGNGTASEVFQGTTTILSAAGGEGATYSYSLSDYDSSRDSYRGYAGNGGSGGGHYKDRTVGGAGGTDGGDGADAYQNTDDTVKRGKGQGTTTKCSFVTNSPAYGGGGGGSRGATSIADVVEDSINIGLTLSECLEQARQQALASNLYALLAGGSAGGGHGGCWYRGGKAFDHDEDGDEIHDFKSGYIACTNGTAGTGGGGAGGFHYNFDPNNGYSARMNVTSGLGGTGLIIYRFYEEQN